MFFDDGAGRGRPGWSFIPAAPQRNVDLSNRYGALLHFATSLDHAHLLTARCLSMVSVRIGDSLVAGLYQVTRRSGQ